MSQSPRIESEALKKILIDYEARSGKEFQDELMLRLLDEELQILEKEDREDDLDEAFSQGREEGYDDGYDAGYDNGFEAGKNAPD
jgi:flagellar biosynthesis/type III secretory pathway protein FliH